MHAFLVLPRVFNRSLLLNFLALVLAGLAISALAGKAAGGEGKTAGPEKTANTDEADKPVRVRQEHPYLLYTPKRVNAFQQRIKQSPATRQAWQAMLEDAKRVVEDDNHNLNDVAKLSLAYQVTGEDRFAAQARDILMRVCQQERWDGGVFLNRTPPWHAGLGTAHKLRKVAIGYDSIYNFLSPKQRETLADRIVEVGIKPTLGDWVNGERRIHSIDSMGHNWWSACVFMAGLGSLAVAHEKPAAADWLARIHRASAEWAYYAGSKLETKPDTFDDGGAFYESVGYAGFGTSQYLLFRLGWQNAIRSHEPTKISFLTGIGDYFINASYPDSDRLMSLTFGDSGVHSTGRRSVALLWALGRQKPRFLWYLDQISDGYRDALSQAGPLGLLYYPSRDQWQKMQPKSPGLDRSHLYDDIGWAMLRSSWRKDATLLGVKSGFTWNHSHADNNSFVLFHDGEYLLIDSGKSGYRRPEYDDYYRQSRAHNVVLFNGRGEMPEDTFRGSQLPGSVQHLIDAGRLKYVWADATGPMSHVLGRNFRHFLWIGDVILVIDDVRAHEVGRFQWLLHYDGQAKRDGLDLEVRKNQAGVDVRPLFPEPFPNTGFEHDFPGKMNLKEKTGLAHGKPETQKQYYALEPAKKMRGTKFVTAIILKDDDSPPPRVERFETPDMRGIKIQQDDKVTNVYLNLLADGRRRHLNSNLRVNGWETDAYLTAITYPADADRTDPDAATRYFIGDGSYLRRGDKVVLDSLANVYATWTQQQDGLGVRLQGQPVINARLRWPQAPDTVRLNGEARDVPYDANRQLMRLHLDRR